MHQTRKPAVTAEGLQALLVWAGLIGIPLMCGRAESAKHGSGFVAAVGPAVMLMILCALAGRFQRLATAHAYAAEPCPHGMPGGLTRTLCAECRMELEQ